MTLHTCAISGEESEGKHYILRTTEGEELVSPHVIINPVNVLKEIARDWGKLKLRMERLEKLLVELGADADQEQKKTDAAAPKKTAAPKAPAPRKAAD